jgi:hypothetical protein
VQGGQLGGRDPAARSVPQRAAVGDEDICHP